MCGDAAARSAVNFRSSVTPHCSIGNVCGIAVHRKALAPQQLQFACGTTHVPADASVRRNHAMARNVYRYRVIVQGIADGPCGFRGSHSGAQRLVADQRAARHRLESVEDLFLERISCKGQVDMLAQRFRVSGHITAHFLTNFSHGPLVLHRIELQPQICQCRRDIAVVVDIVSKRDSAPDSLRQANLPTMI